MGSTRSGAKQLKANDKSVFTHQLTIHVFLYMQLVIQVATRSLTRPSHLTSRFDVAASAVVSRWRGTDWRCDRRLRLFSRRRRRIDIVRFIRAAAHQKQTKHRRR